jgi:outer membrane protein, multidrug efflux system
LSQLALVQQTRAQYEHAIAVLVGSRPPALTVPVAPLQATPPPVPLGVPSDVLQRRPDISTAERQMAYQNAQVGIARAAFYPHITLSGSGGWQSRRLAPLLNAPSLFWSLGADALQPIFEGGRNRANLAAARAAYDQSVANYRQSVLTAFQQVEDGISNLSTLSQALSTQGRPSRMRAAPSPSPTIATSAESPATSTSSPRRLLCSAASGWRRSCSASRWSAPSIW